MASNFLRVVQAPQRLLVGQFVNMCYANNQTYQLWRNFMPRRNEIVNTVSDRYFSLQRFEHNFDFRMFNGQTIFEKWACKEVANFDKVPEGMSKLTLVPGAYAVFLHKGQSSEFLKTIDFIYKQWLPSEGYVRDNRPNFELLGEKYDRESEESEEEVWVPIKKKINF